jgi:hypothetical protein
MEKRRIEQWLRRTVASEMGHSLLFAAGCFALSAGVLALTTAMTLIAVWFVLDGAVQLGIGSRLEGRPWLAMVGALVVVVLLFRGNARSTRRHLDSTAIDEGREQQGAEVEPGRLPAWGSLLAYPGTGSLGPLDFVYTGPRLFMIGWSHLCRAWRLRRIDIAACAPVVAVMLSRRERCQLRELLRHEEVNQPLRQLAQLRELGGVIFFRNPPHGFSLRSSWRHALSLKWGESGQDVEQPITHPGTRRVGTLDEQVLGVPPNASPGEAERAYHRHIEAATDAVAIGADPDLQRIAADHARAVRSAYDEFMARHSKGKEGLAGGTVEQLWEQHRRKENGTGPRSKC